MGPEETEKSIEEIVGMIKQGDLSLAPKLYEQTKGIICYVVWREWRREHIRRGAKARGMEVEDLVGLSKSVKKARNDTINDARRRIPGKLATVVTQYYGIKKSEIMPNKGAKAAANISNAYEKGIVYTGRLLTPTHFKMKAKTSVVPFQRADGSTGRRKVQTISAEIIKGQRKILGSSLFLAKSGAADGAPMIPFQRRGKARTPIDVFKTLSVPQMLTGDLARPELEACIVEVMNERYTHNLNRHMSRYVKGKVGL